MAETGQDISIARKLLEKGDLVAVPTETVYGLAGNALDNTSVSKIFEVKNRPSFDPLIIHIPDFDQLEKYVERIPNQAEILAKHFWPGPLTLLLRKNKIVPDLVTSGMDKVAVRCPRHPLTLKLLSQLDFPLAAPSANPFGYVSPTTAQHVNDQLGSKIKYILDGGASQIGLESTIVGFENGRTIVHRLGGVSLEELEAVAGPLEVTISSTSNPQSPGRLDSHYAPTKKIFVADLEKAVMMVDLTKVGVLSFQKNYQAIHQVVLSPSGDIREAARNLFGAMRELDNKPIEMILTELLPEEGLGRAINDRLRRASTK